VAYLEEASSWRTRKRHRQQVTLLVIFVVLLVTGGVGYAVYSGALGGDEPLNVSALPPCPATKAPITPRQVVVNVYNATDRRGLAAKTATTLSLREFAVGTVANDPRSEKVTGTVIVRYGPRGKAAAQLLSRHLPAPKLVIDKRKGAAVDLVLGAKFAGLLPLASTTPTLPATPTCRPVSPTSGGQPTTPAKSPAPRTATTARTP
jgi:hypothetical protein